MAIMLLYARINPTGGAGLRTNSAHDVFLTQQFVTIALTELTRITRSRKLKEIHMLLRRLILGASGLIITLSSGLAMLILLNNLHLLVDDHKFIVTLGSIGLIMTLVGGLSIFAIAVESPAAPTTDRSAL